MFLSSLVTKTSLKHGKFCALPLPGTLQRGNSLLLNPLARPQPPKTHPGGRELPRVRSYLWSGVSLPLSRTKGSARRDRDGADAGAGAELAPFLPPRKVDVVTALPQQHKGSIHPSAVLQRCGPLLSPPLPSHGPLPSPRAQRLLPVLPNASGKVLGKRRERDGAERALPAPLCQGCVFLPSRAGFGKVTNPPRGGARREKRFLVLPGPSAPSAASAVEGMPNY